MRPATSILLGLTLTCSTISASAATFLYTFRGNVDYIEIDSNYLSDFDFDSDYLTENDTFHVGDSVEYVFKVDLDLAGYCNGPLNTSYSDICTGADILDTESINYFFAALHSATKLAPAIEEETTFNYGLNQTNTGWLIGDSAVFIVSPYSEPVESWIAKSELSSGTLVTGIDAWSGLNGTGQVGRVTSTLELVSVVPFEENTKKCQKHKKYKGKNKEREQHNDRRKSHR